MRRHDGHGTGGGASFFFLVVLVGFYFAANILSLCVAARLARWVGWVFGHHGRELIWAEWAEWAEWAKFRYEPSLYRYMAQINVGHADTHASKQASKQAHAKSESPADQGTRPDALAFSPSIHLKSVRASYRIGRIEKLQSETCR
jgi:hypothetical protein